MCKRYPIKASIFQYDTGNDHYGLRNENVLINPEVRTQRGENCIHFYLPRVVNNTNQDILEKNLSALLPRFCILKMWSAVMLLVVQSRIAQDALKFKKKENWFTKTPELHIASISESLSTSCLVFLYIMLFFSLFLFFSIALKEFFFLCV